MDLDKLCIGCMEEKGDRLVCPLCGYSEAGSGEPSIFLPPRTILTEKYLIGRVLGQGGFGITYLARDINLDIKIAVKEFFPQGLVSRGPTSKDVISFTGDLKQQFEFGLERFLHEARTLARFADHANIVTVRDFFRANGTAYMVMNYIEGMTLEAYLEQAGGKLTFKETLDILMPVLDALKEVHLAGIMHRDISPDNIFIDTSGRVVLIDFGAARQEMQQKGRGLSVILKAGYAPEEQYRTRGEQGPWTDVYAAAGTMYRSLTGQVPMESIDRLAEDSLVPPSELGADIEPAREQALLKAMALKARDRYRTIEEFQDKLLQEEKPETPTLPEEATEPEAQAIDTGQKEPAGSEKKPVETLSEEPEELPVYKTRTQSGLKQTGLVAAAVLLGGMLLYGGVSFLDLAGEEEEELLVADRDIENNDQAPGTAADTTPEEDIIITVASNGDKGEGTLRWALETAETGAVITFDPEVFPPDDPAVIYLQTALPPLVQGNMTIDASNAGVIIDGINAQETTDYLAGITIESADNIIMGLQVINCWSHDDDGNLAGAGILISGESANNNSIGGDRSEGSGPTGQGNLLSANLWGLDIVGGASGNVVSGNLIGTDKSGAQAHEAGANELGMIIGNYATNNIIGPDNIIAYNNSGIDIGEPWPDEGTINNTVTANSIFNNGSQINVRSGANKKMQAPQIRSVNLPDGTVEGTACPGCTVEIFSDSGNQGEIFEGSVEADEEGNFSFSAGRSLVGPNITATATDPDGNTSSFSEPGR